MICIICISPYHCVGCGELVPFMLFDEGVLLLLVDIFENASRVSGKFGGVAGVLHGVIT